MAKPGRTSLSELSDSGLIKRIQSIYINAAEGQRSVSDDRQYVQLRKEVLKRRIIAPEWIATHPTVNSFVAYVKGSGDRSEQVAQIRAEFDPTIHRPQLGPATAADSSAWTGMRDSVVRVRLVKSLLPLADAAVDSLIESLSEPNPNGAPLLDSRLEAIEHLRRLHRTIGKLLTAIDDGHLNDGLGEGLAADAARFAKKAARALRDDPVPYVASALILGIFEACGIGALGGYLTGVAQNIRKGSGKGA